MATILWHLLEIDKHLYKAEKLMPMGKDEGGQRTERCIVIYAIKTTFEFIDASNFTLSMVSSIVLQFFQGKMEFDDWSLAHNFEAVLMEDGVWQSLSMVSLIEVFHWGCFKREKKNLKDLVMEIEQR